MSEKIEQKITVMGEEFDIKTNRVLRTGKEKGFRQKMNSYDLKCRIYLENTYRAKLCAFLLLYFLITFVAYELHNVLYYQPNKIVTGIDDLVHGAFLLELIFLMITIIILAINSTKVLKEESLLKLEDKEEKKE